MPLRFLPEVLERARKEQGLSRDKLASLSGVSRVSVWNAERGVTQDPRPDKVKALADALGIDVADLYAEAPTEDVA